MAATLTIVNQYGQTLASHRLAQGQNLAIRAQDQVQYHLAAENGLAPNAVAERAGKDLLVKIDGEAALRIEDYFLLDDSGLANPLLGLNESGQYVAYGMVDTPAVPVEHVLAAEVAAVGAAGESASIPALTAFGIGALALGGMALAAQSGSENRAADTQQPQTPFDPNQPAPPAGGGTNPPPAGGGTNPPPAGGGSNPPPAGGGTNPPPAGGGSNPPPAGGGSNPPPAGGGNNPPPAGGGNNPPPGGGNNPPPTTPTPNGSIAISGEAKVGQTLSAPITDPDGVSGSPRYQWLADGQPIQGATQSTYTVSQADIGKAITVQASYTDNAQVAEKPLSPATAQVIDETPPPPQNHAPSDITLSADRLPENQAGAMIGKLTTVDEDKNDQHTYRINDPRFEVDAQGKLKLKDGVKVEFANEQTINLTITTSDGKGGSYSETFTLQVQDDPAYPAPNPPANDGKLGVHVPKPKTDFIANVKDAAYGAKGDGQTDDTAAIQKAIDAVAAKGGGIVDIPAGTYMLDAVNNRLHMKSHVILRLADDTVLKAITNGETHYDLIRFRNVDNAHIIGGTLEGDRETHTGTDGEAGHGIRLMAATNITIENVTVKNMWGDGIYLGKDSTHPTQNENVTVYQVTSDHNRRQGLSVTHGKNIKILNSIFQNTDGTDPRAGIDLEPNAGQDVSNVEIRGNQFLDNHIGFLVANNSAGSRVQNVVFENNTLSGNPRDAIILRGLEGGSIKGNTIHIDPDAHHHDSGGIRLYNGDYHAVKNPDPRPTRDVEITGNTLYGGTIMPRDTSGNTIADNQFKAAVFIRGNAQNGEELTAQFYDGDGTSKATNLQYQWLADGVPIDGATVERYMPRAADREKTLTVKVSFTDNAGQAESAESDATPPVDNIRNQSPTDITLSADRLPENQAGAMVGKLTTNDPDQGDTHTYSVNDQRFEVDAQGNLKLKDGVKVEFAAEKTIDLTITTSDGKRGGTYSETFTLQVQDDPAHPAPNPPTPPDGGKLGVYVPKPVTDFIANVKDAAYGAKGDGQTDDTAAIQKAVDAVAAKGGGIVDIPAGTYLVDGTKNVVMKSNVIVRMADDTTLKTIPNDQPGYAIFRAQNVENVHFLGGTLMGDRYEHGTTEGQSGFGIVMQSARNVVVENVVARDFWGDGFYVGRYYLHEAKPENITFYNITADGNRRQGLMIADGERIKILKSTFKNTQGHPMEAGIDIEPNAAEDSPLKLPDGTRVGQEVRDVEVSGNTFENNAYYGIVVSRSRDRAATLEDVRITKNTFTGDGHAIHVIGLKGGEISGNTIADSNIDIPYFDINLEYSQNVAVRDNTMYGGRDRDLVKDGTTSSNTISGSVRHAAVHIEGSAKVGETLTATVLDGDGQPTPPHITYTWRAGSDIVASGKNLPTYTVRPEDAGKAISVEITFPHIYGDVAGQQESATSAPTLPVGSAGQHAPTDLFLRGGYTLPEKTDGAAVGKVTVRDKDVADHYALTVSDERFEIDSNGILKLKAGQQIDYAREKYVSLALTARDDSGALSEAFTLRVQPPTPSQDANKPAAVIVQGFAKPGETLTAVVKDADDAPAGGIRYQWYADSQAIDGATASTYQVRAADAGKQIQVKTSFTDNAGHSESMMSGATMTVPGIYTPPAPTPPAPNPPANDGKLGVHVPKPVTDFVANAKDYGAKGDGQSDDTAAIQKTINAVAAKGGGIVEIPTGQYLVDAVKSLHLKSNVIVRMADDAVLKAIPNDAENYAIFTLREVDNAHLIGGTLVGERDAHLGSEGEWGMGVLIRSSSNVVVENVTARDFWGDGFYTGKAYPDAKHNENIVFYQITADNNRRQGITLSDGNHTKVLNSVLQNTQGTAPQAGIDLEPNGKMREVLRDVEIRGNTFTNNGAQGVQVGGSVQGYDAVFDVTIADNHFSGNPHSVYISGLKGGRISGNTIHHDNFAYEGAIPGKSKPRMGIFFSPDRVASEGVSVEGNTIYGSGVRTWPKLLQDNAIGDNTYKAAVFVRGDAQVGNTLESYVYDHDGLPADAQAIRYQWQADGKDIAGANGASYTVRPQDAGKAIRVQVDFTDNADQSERAESAATAPVPDATPNPPANDGKLGVHVPKPASDFVANVKDVAYGAKGDGKADDTLAIQKAIDAVAEKGGGVVEVPGGTYMIDATAQQGPHSLSRNYPSGLMMKPNVILKLADDTVLKAMPTDQERYNLITFYKADNAHLIGGTLIGERDAHQGLTGQYGYGVRVISSKDVAIENVTAKDFWGDGFYVGINSGADPQSQNIVFYNIVADNNRRQGLSITDAKGVQVLNSVFKNTNGHMPLSGIDIEPNPGRSTTDIDIRGNRFENNSGFGVVVSGSQFNRDNAYGKAHADTVTKNINIENNHFEGNRDGISVGGLIGGRIAGNTIRHGNYVTSPTGGIRKLWLDDMSRDITVENNTIYGGGYPRGHIENDKLIEGGGIENKGQNNTIRNNSYKADVFVRGHMKAGETLTAHVYDGDIVSADVRYQWRADGKPIANANARSYRLTDADNGKRISVHVEFADGADEKESATSAETNPVGSPQPNHAPHWAYVQGNYIADETPGHVIGNIGVHDPDPGETFSYRINDDRFEIVADALKLKNGISIDDANEKSVSLAIEITDSGGDRFVRELDLTVAEYGSDGKDTFAVDGNGVKTIVGFNVSHGDVLQLKSDAFTALEKGALAPSAFVKGKAATASSADHRILYDTESGALAYDPDGNGSAAAVTIARLDPAAELEAAHILII